MCLVYQFCSMAIHISMQDVNACGLYRTKMLRTDIFVLVFCNVLRAAEDIGVGVTANTFRCLNHQDLLTVSFYLQCKVEG